MSVHWLCSGYQVWAKHSNRWWIKFACRACVYFILNSTLIIMISKCYIANVSTKQGTQGAEYIHVQTARKISYCSDEFWEQLVSTLQRFTTCAIRRIQQPQPGTPVQTPSLFLISAYVLQSLIIHLTLQNRRLCTLTPERKRVGRVRWTSWLSV